MNTWNQNNIQQMGMPQQYNPYMQRLPVYSAAPIHGENAAWQFPMGPNSEIYLPDADEDIIWWIRTDTTGNRSVQPFDVSPHKKPEPVDMNNILERLGAVEEWINGKSNKSNAKRSATTTAAPATPTVVAATVE